MSAATNGSPPPSTLGLGSNEEMSDQLQQILNNVREEIVMEWPDKWSPDHWPKECAKCAVCFCIPFGKIQFCDDGHSMCRYCLQKVGGMDCKKCPICKTKLFLSDDNGDDTSWNFALERIIKKGKFYCPRGCKEVRSGNDMFVHIEDDCRNREVSCPLCHLETGEDDIFFGVRVLEFIDHLNTHRENLKNESHHKFKKLLRMSSTQAYPGLQHLSPNMFKFDEKIFMINFRVQRSGYLFDMLLMWVQIMGGWEEAKSYKSIITLTNNRGNQVSWEIPVSWVHGRRPAVGKICNLTIRQLQDFSSEFEFNPLDHTVFKFEPEIVMLRIQPNGIDEPSASTNVNQDATD